MILDLESEQPVGWQYSKRKGLDVHPPSGHLELMWRTSKPDRASFADDLRRLHRTVLDAAARPAPVKVWTALVLLGPGWRDFEDSLESLLHEHFHAPEYHPERVEHRQFGYFWNFPDVIAMPGRLYKKHAMAPEPLALDVTPAFAAASPGRHDQWGELRPLALARTFFRYHIRNRAEDVVREQSALPVEEWPSVIGPMWGYGREPHAISLRDHSPDSLWVRGSDDRFYRYDAEAPRCSLGSAFRYRRTAGEVRRVL